MSGEQMEKFCNCEAISLGRVPLLPVYEFRRQICEAVRDGARIAALFGKEGGREGVCLFVVLAHDRESKLSAAYCEVNGRYPALTPVCPQAHWFEREIAEQWGIVPEGHPWLKPIRFHKSYRAGFDAWDRKAAEPIPPGLTNYFKVSGEEVHEVGVGPVHAGIIEPGHFRFQCHGEKVLHLEISLGFQHRGVERALRGGPGKRTVHYMETLAGDTTIGHALAYCQGLETVADMEISPRAQTLRAIALELERLANHAGDLGALANDVGFLPTASFCGRIRGDFLNLTAFFCGNRFGRSWVRPGGVFFDPDAAKTKEFLKRLKKAKKDVTVAVNLLWNSPSVMARFEEVGIVPPDLCEALGLVGPVARASGAERDIRFDFPSGIYRFVQIPVSVGQNGDAFSRAYVRWLEIQRSLEFIKEQTELLPEGSASVAAKPLMPETFAVSLVEGWRGEICHTLITDANGKFSHYKVIDPSFHNWMGLAMALRNEEISDFPLCNKSFNLSYCGHDL